MRTSSDKLRKVGQEVEYTPEMINEVVRCQEDIIYFAEHYYHIVTNDEGRKLIELRDYQKKMLKVLVNPPNNKQHVIVCSSRQIGKTVVTSIFIMWFVLFHRDKVAAILADKEKTANKNLKGIKFAYQELPLFLQQGVTADGWNASSIILENGSQVLAASTASSSIRGQTISLLFLDEYAHVPSHIQQDFMASVYPTIVTGLTSKIIMVSTPNGLEAFYNVWRKAIEGKDDPTGKKGNSYYPIKVNWWEVPGRTEDFKKKIIRDIGLVKWNVEFAAKFVGSVSTLVDGDILETLKVKEPLATKWSGMLLVYEHPEPNKQYVIGVDTGKGIGKDYSAIQVFKINAPKDIEQVAVYRNNNIIPRDFAQVVISISEYYNNSYIMVESNDVGELLCDIIWNQFECERLVNCDKNGLGIRSTRSSKLSANMLTKEYVEAGFLKIVDEHTVYEMSRYEEITPNVFRCGDDVHDDLIIGCIWALWFLKTPAYEGQLEENGSINNEYKVDGSNLDKYDNDDAPVVIFD